MARRRRNARSTAEAAPPRLLKGRLLRGGNIHHPTTVFSQRVDLGGLFGLRSTDVGADFAARFIERFGALESLCPGGSLPEATRWALAAEPGLPLVEVLLAATLAVERCLACEMCRLDVPGFSRLVQRGGEVELVWESQAAGTSRAAAAAAFAGLVELLPVELGGPREPRRDFASQLARLRRRCRRRQWSPSTAVLAQAAKQCGLAHELIAGNYLRLGEGVLQQVVSESALELVARPAQGADSAAARGSRRRAFGKRRLHRLLVVEGSLVSALRCDPPRITGDGTSSIDRLIGRLNRDPRRGSVALPRIRLDARLRADLEALGLGADHVLASGEELVLPGVLNIERGAIPVDVTDRVHDSVREVATLAAREQERAVVSVEFLTADITRSCRGGRGRVIAADLPTAPFLHALPDLGRTAEVGAAVLAQVFPAGVPARIPTALIVGERGTRSIALGLDRFLRRSHQGVGLATRERTTIQGRPIDPTSLSRHGGPDFLLGDPRVDLVVSVVSPRKIVEQGLRIDHCSVAALLDPAPGSDLEVYRAGAEVSVAATTETVVISVDNPLAEATLDSLEPARVLLVAKRREHPLAERHGAAGGGVIVPSQQAGGEIIELWCGADRIASLPFSSLRAGQAGPSGGRMRKALYAAGLAFALGVPEAQLGKRPAATTAAPRAG